MALTARDYLLPPDGGDDLLAALGERFSLARGEAAQRVETLHDTFDWRLHAVGGELRTQPAPRAGQTDGGSWLVWTHGEERIRRRLESDARPGFAQDLPAGPLRDILAPLLAMRRLLPTVEIHLDAAEHRLLDDNRKTVARLEILHGEAIDPEAVDRRAELAPRLRIRPLRGYDDAFRRLVEVLEDDLALERAGDALPAAALVAVGRRPGSYSSKPRHDLDPSMRADDALVDILRALLHTLEINQDGTRRDLDSEFLHDFRVAGRRTRSALGQVKKVFPADALAPFRREFSWLGKITGPTRDLDVYLLKFPAYRDALPRSSGDRSLAGGADDLAPLETFLRRRQREEQKILSAALDGPRYRRLLQDWHAFLDHPPRGEAADAERPIVDVASERIWKAYRRVRNRGALAVEHHSAAQDLHSLRIECKKLRYLLEFFRNLYPAAEIDPAIKALKKLQDNLGDFNDYEVQQRALGDFAHQMHIEGLASVDTLLAMGRLLDVLARGQESERRAFAKRFASFAAKKNRRRFEGLFRG